MQKVVGIFLDTATGKCAAIKEALDRGDLPTVSTLVHSFTPSAKTVGATNLAAECATVENTARQGNAALCEAAARHMQEEVDAILPVLRGALEAHKARGAAQLSNAAPELRPRVLLVDDDEVGRMLTRLALQPLGLRMAEAGDGKSGLALMNAERPTMVLLDVSMPGMDGFETCAEMYRCDASVAIVMLTGREDPEVEQRALQAGAIAVLRKSNDWTALARQVEQILMRQVG